MSGAFITFEGVEGAGKTTNVQFAKEVLESNGIDVFVTREPGGTPLGNRIRDVLLDTVEEEFDPRAELLLMFAARAQNLHQVIRPQLAAGRWVICDRFTDASFAYQGAGRHVSRSLIELLANELHGDISVTKTFCLDIPVEISRERIGHREHDRIEQEDTAFFQRVRDAYLNLADQDAERYELIDATLPLTEVQAKIRKVLLELVERQQ